MKVEINNENKAKFFALYWGQKVIKDDACQLLYVSSNINLEHDSWYLNLKPLSSLSDEDAVELADFLGINPPEDGWSAKIDELVRYSEGMDCPSIFIDWLRSKSYATQWMGLSVDEMVEAGWIKLIENK